MGQAFGSLPEHQQIALLENLVTALVLLLGTETDFSSKVTLDAYEMDRATRHNLVATRYIDPYQMKLEVSPK